MSTISYVLTGALSAAVLATSAWAQQPSGGQSDGLREGAGGLTVIVAIDDAGAPLLAGEAGAVAVFLHPEPLEQGLAGGDIPPEFQGQAVFFSQVLDSGATDISFFGAERDAQAAAQINPEAPNPPVFVVSADNQPLTLPGDAGSSFIPALTSADQAASLEQQARAEFPDASVTVEAYGIGGVLGRMQEPGAPNIRVMSHPDTMEWAEAQDAPTQ